MKIRKILGATSLMMMILSLSACGQAVKPIEKNIAKADEKGFAVLELFTSEGCSSCPPADEVLAEIQQEAKDKAVYLLAYHVDYWNRLGWKDVFSNADFSKRQLQYRYWLNAEVYTPQLIVNGKAEFVGSDASAIRGSIVNELAVEPITKLKLNAYKDSGGLKVHYQASNTIKGSHILIAIIQKSAQSKVERGENAGRTLSHLQIVRKLQNEPLNDNGDGNAIIELPKDFNAQTWEILGLIQDTNSGKILGAAKVSLHDGSTAKDYPSK